MIKYIRLVFIVVTMLPLASNAQSFYNIRKERSLILVGGLGTSTYFGELKTPQINIDAKPTASLGLQFYLNPHINVRSEFTYFRLTGDDSKAAVETGRKDRNLSFASNNYELNFTGAFNMFPLGKRFYQRTNFNFYGFAGLGLMYMNPKTEYQGQTYALQPLQTEGIAYSRFQPVIPYGLGARVKVNPFLNIVVEAGWRLTFTDYLDDVSTVHPDKSGWTDPIRIALSDRRQEGNPALPNYETGFIRGNSDKNDNYFLLTLKVEYYLPKNFLMRENRKLYNVKRKAYYR